MRFVEPVTYALPATDPWPNTDVVRTMEDIRQRILMIMGALQHPVCQQSSVSRGIKELQILASSIVVLPLASFLTVTANASLDSVEPAVPRGS